MRLSGEGVGLSPPPQALSPHPQPLTYLYASDCDGRVTHDGRQGLDISYNILNLPSVVTNEDGMDTRYRYLSDGTKRSVSNGGILKSVSQRCAGHH